MLVMSRRILGAFRRGGYECLFVQGPQGIGKTTYAMLILYEIYRDWDLVLHYTVFDPRDVLGELEYCLARGKRIPAVLFDDAGIHLSKYLYSVDPELAATINALFNMARTVVAGVIMTSPDMDVLKELRKKSWWVGEPIALHGRDRPERAVKLYYKRILVSGKVCHKPVALDRYRLDQVPPEVRREYDLKRRLALKPVIQRLREKLGAAAQPNPHAIEKALHAVHGTGGGSGVQAQRNRNFT